MPTSSLRDDSCSPELWLRSQPLFLTDTPPSPSSPACKALEPQLADPSEGKAETSLNRNSSCNTKTMMLAPQTEGLSQDLGGSPAGLPVKGRHASDRSSSRRESQLASAGAHMAPSAPLTSPAPHHPSALEEDSPRPTTSPTISSSGARFMFTCVTPRGSSSRRDILWWNQDGMLPVLREPATPSPTPFPSLDPQSYCKALLWNIGYIPQTCASPHQQHHHAHPLLPHQQQSSPLGQPPGSGRAQQNQNAHPRRLGSATGSLKERPSPAHHRSRHHFPTPRVAELLHLEDGSLGPAQNRAGAPQDSPLAALRESSQEARQTGSPVSKPRVCAAGPGPRSTGPSGPSLGWTGSPVEALEIGSRSAAQGESYPVRPLAAVRLRDQAGRPTWRLVTVALEDPMAYVLVRVFRACSKPAALREVLQDVLKEFSKVFPEFTVRVEGAEEPDGILGTEGAAAMVLASHTRWLELVQVGSPENGGIPPKDKEWDKDKVEHRRMWASGAKRVPSGASPRSPMEGGRRGQSPQSGFPGKLFPTSSSMKSSSGRESSKTPGLARTVTPTSFSFRSPSTSVLPSSISAAAGPLAASAKAGAFVPTTQTSGFFRSLSLSNASQVSGRHHQSHQSPLRHGPRDWASILLGSPLQSDSPSEKPAPGVVAYSGPIIRGSRPAMGLQGLPEGFDDVDPPVAEATELQASSRVPPDERAGSWGGAQSKTSHSTPKGHGSVPRRPFVRASSMPVERPSRSIKDRHSTRKAQKEHTEVGILEGEAQRNAGTGRSSTLCASTPKAPSRTKALRKEGRQRSKISLSDDLSVAKVPSKGQAQETRGASAWDLNDLSGEDEEGSAGTRTVAAGTSGRFLVESLSDKIDSRINARSGVQGVGVHSRIEELAKEQVGGGGGGARQGSSSVPLSRVGRGSLHKDSPQGGRGPKRPNSVTSSSKFPPREDLALDRGAAGTSGRHMMFRSSSVQAAAQRLLNTALKLPVRISRRKCDAATYVSPSAPTLAMDMDLLTCDQQPLMRTTSNKHPTTATRQQRSKSPLHGTLPTSPSSKSRKSHVSPRRERDRAREGNFVRSLEALPEGL